MSDCTLPAGVMSAGKLTFVVYAQRRPVALRIPTEFEIAKIWWRIGHVIYRCKKAWPVREYDAHIRQFMEGFRA